MVTTDLRIAQASIELMAGFVCLLLAVIVIINRHSEKSIKLIVKLLLFCGALFVSDAFTYLSQGNISTFNVFMHRASNFAVFFLNFCLAELAVSYVYSILQEEQVIPSRIYQKIVHFGFCAAVTILITNLFTGWMYTFDAANQYHRNWGWYVYTGFSLLCLSASCALVIKYRRVLDRFTLFSLLFFELFPIVGVMLQTVFFGIAVTNMGIGLSIVLLLVSYLIRWNRLCARMPQNSAQVRRSYDTLLLFVIMAASVAASIAACIISLRHVALELSASSSQVISRIVSDRVENLFLRPITVTEVMSKDVNLQENMRQDGPPEDVEQNMSVYLESIRAGFDYQMVYTVCHQSGDYYTYNGFVKTIDPEHDPTDIWYRNFLSAGKDFVLELDTDPANDWALSVFVNRAVRNQNGDFLGVCGIGLELGGLQEQLLQFETQYNIKISLYDRSGRYQITSTDSMVGSGLLPADFPEMVSGEEFHFDNQNGTLKTTWLMEDLGWCITVEDFSPERVDISGILFPNIVIFLTGMFLLAVAFCVITIRERNISQELVEKRKTSLLDELTGIKNRRALQDDCKQIAASGSLSEKTVILMDLNELKRANDTLGHHVGDELLIGTTQCMLRAMGNQGEMYRTGGDEFVVILSCPQQEAETILVEFDRLTSEWRGNYAGPISVSKGIVHCAEFPQLDFSAVMELADRRMYEDKHQYYLNTGKTRRR